LGELCMTLPEEEEAEEEEYENRRRCGESASILV
jgi:hypothetical protein